MKLKPTIHRFASLAICALLWQAACLPMNGAGLIHRYSFTADASDSVGSAHGALLGGAVISGGAVSLNGTSAYVNLPNGLFTNVNSVTFETWITDNGSAGWARLYDFGSGTGGEDFAVGTAGVAGTRYLFLCPLSGPGTLRGAITLTGGGGGEQIMEWPGTPLPTGTQKHIVWTVDANLQLGRLYVDGVLVATNGNMTITPSQLEPSVNNWLGRAQFNADPFLKANINEFRMYDAPMDALRVAINAATGPDSILANPGALTSIALSTSTTVLQGGTLKPQVIGSFANVPSVDLSSVPEVVLTSSNPNVLSVVAGGYLSANEPGTANITVSYQGQTQSRTFQVMPLPQTLIHRYNFATDASDSEGGANGVLTGGAAIANGAVVLNGTSAYVDLPNNLLSSLNSVTLEAWATDNGSSGWARVWDFGNSSGGEGAQGGGTSYMFMAWPIGGSTGLRGAYKLTGGAEQILDYAVALGTGVRRHIVWTTDGDSHIARIYVDGVLVGTSTAFTDTPAVVGATFNDWLGRSQFNDPYFKGAIDEFRVYNVAISAKEVQDNFLLGPDVSPQSGPVAIITQPQSVTVNERQPVSFTVSERGTRPYMFQWFRDGTLIPGATNATYRLASVLPADSGAVFTVAVSNQVAATPYVVISSNAVLTVITDVITPTVSQIFNVGSGLVNIIFSEAISPTDATNTANYGFVGGMPITSATLAADGQTVTLATGPIAYGSDYTVTISGIHDLATTPNVITPGTAATFTGCLFAPYNVGNAQPPGSMQVLSNGVILSGAGSGIVGASDQFTFGYEQLTGDFDVQAHLPAFTTSNAYARAGLMARSTLAGNSPFAGVLATPCSAGISMGYRIVPSAQAVYSGNYVTEYPSTWVRLKRTGDLFVAFASTDGQGWVQISSMTLSLGNTLYVGLAVTGQQTGQAATAQFIDAGATANPAIIQPADLPESPGPSSRRTGLTFSEIMYRPAPRIDAKNLEFIEIYNSNPWAFDIGGYRVSSDIDFVFPKGTSIAGNGYIVVAANPADVQSIYSITGVYGPYANSLKASGTIRLRDEQDTVLLEVVYKNSAPWPVAADGTGHSIVLSHPSYGEGDPRAWSISDSMGGSPGRLDPYTASALRSVVINEILPNAGAAPAEDYVELYNHSSQAIDISGCILTDNAASNKFHVAANTVLPAAGHIVFSQTQMGFGLKAGGDTIYFKNPQSTRILNAVRFDAQATGVSYGRWPDGSPEFYPQASQTPGVANSGFRTNAIVINEIMYHPISGNDDEQYIELYNQSASAVNVGGWEFVDGISYSFPSNTIIPAAGYLVVARNQTNLLAKYANLTLLNTVGDFSGSLSHNGEHLALAMPEINITTNNQKKLVTNTLFVAVDEVTYGDGGRWGQWSDGGGSSLELIDPRSNHRLPANWADSNESAKSSWTTLAATGVLDNGSNYLNGPISTARLGLLDAGECLVDDIEVVPSIGLTNCVQNPGFESGLTGWLLMGSFVRSTLEPGAGATGAALHLRTGNRMFSLANSAQCTLLNTNLGPGKTATLRLKARWLRGTPEILMQLQGNWLEVVGTMAVPSNLGTPGLPNSRAKTNAAPAIYAVSHTPSLPGGGQAAIVTARVDDPDHLAAVTLNYRVDPSPAYQSIPMADDGTGGDAVANDGIFTATIPPQAAGVSVAFVVTALDMSAASSRFPAFQDNNAPDRECVVRFGEVDPTGIFGAYHLWLTQSNVDRWISLPVISNEEMDGTLVYGSRIIYNMGARYAGSPYHQGFTSPYGSACHYNWDMPADDQLLGTTSFNKIHWPGNDIQDDSPNQNVNDSTLQREQAANTFLRGMGQPWIYRRYVAVFVNGHRRGQLMEDAVRPSVTVPDAYFPGDTGGLLYKLQPWFEGSAPQVDGFTPWANQQWCLLMPYVTSGNAYKVARYRWNYEVRDTPNIANNFTNVFTLLSVASTNTYLTDPNWPAMLENIADMDNWLTVVAANHAAGNWDCWGVVNEQNVYAYVSPQQRWKLFMFDYSIVLGNRIAWAPGAELETINADDTTWQHIYSAGTGHPYFRRKYWRALNELANGPMQAAALEPMLDAKYKAFQGAGIVADNPTPIKTWVAQARASILTQFAQRDANALTVFSNVVIATTNMVTLSGEAPIGVATITVGGYSIPLTFTNLLRWTARFPVPAGTNALVVQGLDRFGNAVPGATTNITVRNALMPDSPIGSLVINEIYYNPANPDAEYVEIYNRSTNTTFDISGWQLNGAGVTFPQNSLLGPGRYGIVARSRTVFANTYGYTIPIMAEFPANNLQTGGETLTLLKPGATPAEDVVVSRVRYESQAPWPTSTNGGPIPGALQLMDASKDASRVSNWHPGDGWKYFSFTGTLGGVQLWLYLPAAGTVYVDDVFLALGSNAMSGSNFVRNGDFEAPIFGTWTNTGSYASNSIISSEVKRSGNNSLKLVFTGPGGLSARMYQDLIGVSNANVCTLSFWYYSATTATSMVARTGSAFRPDVNVRPVYLTPGASNSVVAALPPYPALWLNEIEAQNTIGPVENFGEHDPWIELVNTGATPISLEGYFLSDSYTNLQRWAFPSNATINPGQFLVVWADGQPEQTADGFLHANFRPAPGAGALALSRMFQGAPQVLDYFNYHHLPLNASWGAAPDGQPFYRDILYMVTPGITNNTAPPSAVIFINEWMAANNSSTGIVDPANGNYEDWFELYNPGPLPVNLGGYYLTDTLTNKTQYQVPAGYVVPAGGFLLVWADGPPDKNSVSDPTLHVPFKLAQSGEAIGLFAPDGITLIDSVEFGPQMTGMSQGRSPDGSTNVQFLATSSPGQSNIATVQPEPPVFVNYGLLDPSTVFLSFSTIPGRTYRIEYLSDMTSQNWQPFGPDRLADSNRLTLNDTINTATQRYFRAVLVK